MSLRKNGRDPLTAGGRSFHASCRDVTSEKPSPQPAEQPGTDLQQQSQSPTPDAQRK